MEKRGSLVRTTLVAVGVAVASLTACDREEALEENRKARNGSPAGMFTEVFTCRETLAFFRDDKSGLCFAVCWGGSTNGGPGLTLVPDRICTQEPTQTQGADSHFTPMYDGSGWYKADI